MCIGEVGPIAEVCNTFDDDCDSRIDEGNPEGGGACGTDTGDCVAGTRNCRGGTLVCEGSVGPGTEGCDGGDDDCDGRIDEGNPGGGGSCGTDIGQCNPGTNTCTGGSVMCTGAVLPVAEACDSLDNDCDTRIDEGNPGGGAMCGTDTGECTAGTRTCAGGTLACSGERGPAIEACDSLDNDCDARIDEAFSLTTDVNNCGRCGNVCNLAFAIERCTSGTCGILACESGHYDIDHIASNGCEYACDFSGSEVCNSRDDNCDGTVDNGLTPPMICLRAGVCTGTTATCSGTGGWVCSYPSTYQSTETSCDRLDNDCDGAVDEPFPLWGTACSNGVGSCRRTGTYVCNTAGDNVVCNAPAAGLPGTELCDNADNDCDGNTDESIPLASIPTVAVPRAGGGTVNVMTYEASRADATATAEGTATVVACSNSNVIPWTNLTWSEAHAACCALNPGRTCSTSGWRLCDEPDWETACEGSAGTCTWSYASSCTASQPVVCNGDEYDCVSGMSGDQDCLFSTASPVFPMCYANWGANRIYDLSGNVKEWTETARGTGFHAIRGGSYTNVEAGRTCQFAFTVGSDTFRFPNTGFRCCYY